LCVCVCVFVYVFVFFFVCLSAARYESGSPLFPPLPPPAPPLFLWLARTRVRSLSRSFFIPLSRSLAFSLSRNPAATHYNTPQHIATHCNTPATSRAAMTPLSPSPSSPINIVHSSNPDM